MDAFSRSVLKQIEELSAKLESTRNMVGFVPEWSEAVPIEKAKVKGGLGVYRMIYGPTKEVMSIGQGHVGQRKSRHLGVFRNGGVDMVSPNGHVSPSQTGKKMFAFDSNIDNWYFSYCLVPNKSICAEYELQLQFEFEPQFNELSMAGNN